MFKLKFGAYVKSVPSAPLSELAETLGDADFCYATLHAVSRSFAVVIQQLPPQLRDAVCIFYLVLRGLDSVEDDMSFPLPDKLPLLRSFYTRLLEDGWSIAGVGDSAEYRVLLAHFYKVIAVFRQLEPRFQQVILDITRRMGAGMAEFAVKSGSISTLSSYNLYCHFVAGLVGHGLSQLFSASGLEDADLQLQERLSNSMGLFLQKTNIIRDYLEDLQAGRTWWPQEVWGQYAPSLDYFAAHPHSARSLACLNHLVNDALAHVPDCLDYLSRLRHKSIFEFCAIPQTMAIATLTEVYGNCEVFQRNVKVRKGMAAKMMLESSSLIQVHNFFRSFAEEIERKRIGLQAAAAEDDDGDAQLQHSKPEQEQEQAVSRQNEKASGKEEKDGSAVSNGHHSNGHQHSQPQAQSGSSLPSQRLLQQEDGQPSAAALLEATSSRTASLVSQVLSLTQPGHHSPTPISYINLLAWSVFLLATYYLFSRLRGGGEDGRSDHRLALSVGGGPGFGLMGSGLDVAAVLLCFVSVGYLFGFFGIQYV